MTFKKLVEKCLFFRLFTLVGICKVFIIIVPLFHGRIGHPQNVTRVATSLYSFPYVLASLTTVRCHARDPSESNPFSLTLIIVPLF